MTTQFVWTDPTNANNTQTIVTSQTPGPDGKIDSATSTAGTNSTDYDPLNRPWQTTDVNGLKTQSFYDKRGLVVKKRTEARNEANNSVWLAAYTIYDAAGRAIYTTDSVPEGTPPADVYGSYTIYNATTQRVDSTQRLKGVDVSFVSSGSGTYSTTLVGTPTVISTTSTLYDAQGRAWQTTDEYGRRSQTSGRRADQHHRIRHPQSPCCHTGAPRARGTGQSPCHQRR